MDGGTKYDQGPGASGSVGDGRLEDLYYTDHARYLRTTEEVMRGTLEILKKNLEKAREGGWI